jgi:hypothetical protein
MAYYYTLLYQERFKNPYPCLRLMSCQQFENNPTNNNKSVLNFKTLLTLPYSHERKLRGNGAGSCFLVEFVFNLRIHIILLKNN